MVILVTVLVCAFIAFMLFNNKKMRTYNQFMKRMKKLEESINGITATQKYANQNMAIAIDQNEKKLCVSTMKNNSPVPLTYTFHDIIACEIIEYKVTETTTSINNQEGNQRAANVLGDSVGMVIDSLSGKPKEDKINRIDLKISFNDSQNPYVLLNFLFWEVSKDSEEYQKASKDVSFWYGIIDNIIKN